MNRKAPKPLGKNAGFQIFGIVNVTEDSFSDGGQYLTADKAYAHANALIDDGADILDIGPASSHPDARAVAPAEEIARLKTLVPPLLADGRVVSIDSFQPETQAWALDQGVAWLNDINGFARPEIYPQLAAAQTGLILMHAIQAKGIATRAAPPDGEIWAHIMRFFEARLTTLTQAGVARERLVLDPGMGFFLGNDPATSFSVLAGLAQLKAAFGLPVLVSVSRKSFLRAATGQPVARIGAATLTAEIVAALAGVDYIRTHDVAPLRDARAVLAALPQ